MKYIYRVTILIFILLSSAYGDESGLTTYVQYKQGNPVEIHLNYHGGIKEWDAGVSIANGILILSNAMFISVTNSKSEGIEAKKDKVLSVWADTYFRSPFNLVIDISKFFNLNQPGKYIVQWGCIGVKNDNVFIEIVD